ncbi:hypothetical protein Q7C18_05645 [Nesterenkonia sp. CL21]|uniref:hypothetical protein n=1 Tax=Nesterenkonia sp. CL21 TaxID=3064894 RepID=UPI00287ACAF9|nr:hypothetical protein [Nesterenkonia sp. CL21]MDS2172174.1 hypothetical protein [Nesterenkonia sp. CL21]
MTDQSHRRPPEHPAVPAPDESGIGAGPAPGSLPPRLGSAPMLLWQRIGLALLAATVDTVIFAVSLHAAAPSSFRWLTFHLEGWLTLSLIAVLAAGIAALIRALTGSALLAALGVVGFLLLDSLRFVVTVLTSPDVHTPDSLWHHVQFWVLVLLACGLPDLLPSGRRGPHAMPRFPAGRRPAARPAARLVGTPATAALAALCASPLGLGLGLAFGNHPWPWSPTALAAILGLLVLVLGVSGLLAGTLSLLLRRLGHLHLVTGVTAGVVVALPARMVWTPLANQLQEIMPGLHTTWVLMVCLWAVVVAAAIFTGVLDRPRRTGPG